MSRKTKTTATKEEAKPALVPKLRFPEFRGDGGWNDEALSNVAAVVMGSSPKSECYNERQVGLPLLQGNADIKNRLSAPRIFTSEITKECKIGDILLSVRAPVGSVAKSIHHACIGRGIAAIRAKEPNWQEFLYQWLLSYEPQWVNISQGGTFDAINSDDLRDVVLAAPSPAEQQNIAECLSSVDELMAAQARKVDALKTHKKGLMQQLFPREGETQPRLRFPEFQNAGGWEPTSLGGVARLRNGYAFKSAEYVDDGPYQIITIANVQQGNLTFDSTKRMAALPSDIQHHQVLSIGDILISMTGNVGRVCRVTAEGLLLNQRVGKLIPEEIDAAFFYQLLQRDEFRNTMQLKAAGGAQGNLSGGDITEYAFRMPARQVEQQRIATCLSSLDALITAETQKHEALKTHKKGLMQQLFPAPTVQDHTSEGQRPGLFPSPEEVEA